MEIHQGTTPGFKYFTIITTTLSLFIVNFIFLHRPWYHPEDYPLHFSTFFTIFYTFLFVMWTWAYIKAISVTKDPPKSAILGKIDGRCEKCRINKPIRAHHCSSCGICIEKMDHHCVWTNRCIGYRNYKFFLLFIGYLSCGTFTYDYLAYCFFTEVTNDIPLLIVLIVYIETAIVLLTTVLTNSLFIAHLMMAATNLSTIEYMKGRPFRYFWASEGEIVFGNNPLFWNIPVKDFGKEDGAFFPMVPEPRNLTDIKAVSS